MQYFDNHCHLQDEKFAQSVEEIIVRARENNVRKIVCNGTCEQDWLRVLDIAITYADVIPSIGLHPWFVKNASDSWKDRLECLVSENKVAIGEIGLDRWIKDYDVAAQEDAFRFQLGLARKYSRPVSIHILKAWGWLTEILKSEKLPAEGAVFHGFGGPAEMIQPLVDKRAWFSIAGNVLRQSKTKHRQAIRKIPLNRLLIETDCPDMPPPRSLRFSTRFENEPANIVGIVNRLAQVFEIDQETFSRTVYENSIRFWKSYGNN